MIEEIRSDPNLKKQGIVLQSTSDIIKHCISTTFSLSNTQNTDSKSKEAITTEVNPKLQKKINCMANDLSKLLIMSSKSFEALGVENFKLPDKEARIKQLSEEIFSADIHSKVTTRNSNSLSTNKNNNSESPERRRGLFAD